MARGIGMKGIHENTEEREELERGGLSLDEEVQRAAAVLLRAIPELFDGDLCDVCKQNFQLHLSKLSSSGGELPEIDGQATKATPTTGSGCDDNDIVDPVQSNRSTPKRTQKARGSSDEELSCSEINLGEAVELEPPSPAACLAQTITVPTAVEGKEETPESRPAWKKVLLGRPGVKDKLDGPKQQAERSPANFESPSPSPGGDSHPVKADRMETVSRATRETIRLLSIERKTDFMCIEKVRGRSVNVADGLELHKKMFSMKEQQRLVEFVSELQQKGRAGELRKRTYSEPRKWMPGKGRITIQFGCCYNYALDKNGNPPGIMHEEELVDPLPPVLKSSIRRLVRFHAIPEDCVPDSCIINIYEEGDCIPPHIDHHDFIRPFCTLSLLSECSIVFGATLNIVGPGQFDGPLSIPLPVGSVLVLKGNGADIAKHAVPAVPTRRISITFRRMDPSRVPYGYEFPKDLSGFKALPYPSD